MTLDERQAQVQKQIESAYATLGWLVARRREIESKKPPGVPLHGDLSDSILRTIDTIAALTKYSLVLDRYF